MAVLVGVLEGVSVYVEVRVTVGVCDAVGVLEGVGVWVTVGVSVGVFVIVTVVDGVTVTEGVIVELGDASKLAKGIGALHAPTRRRTMHASRP